MNFFINDYSTSEWANIIILTIVLSITVYIILLKIKLKANVITIICTTLIYCTLLPMFKIALLNVLTMGILTFVLVVVTHKNAENSNELQKQIARDNMKASLLSKQIEYCSKLEELATGLFRFVEEEKYVKPDELIGFCNKLRLNLFETQFLFDEDVIRKSNTLDSEIKSFCKTFQDSGEKFDTAGMKKAKEKLFKSCINYIREQKNEQ